MIQTVKNYTFGGFSGFDEPFTMIVDTRNTLVGGSASNEFKFPQNSDVPDSYIDFLISWGDGQYSRITSKAEASIPHVYTTGGIYEINMYKPKNKPNVVLSPRYENHQLERLKLLEVTRLGKFNNSRSVFGGCINVNFSRLEEESFNFTGSMESNFSGCSSITSFGKLKVLNFSTVSSFSVFRGCINFNPLEPLTINSMRSGFRMFENCYKLQNLLKINAVGLTDLRYMFSNCHAINVDFTQVINCNWGNITNMTGFMTKSSTNENYVEYNPLYYDNLLIALDLGGAVNVYLNFSSKYTSAGATARANLISKGWTISDRGII